MKKMFFALGLGLTLASSVYAANSNVDILNKMMTNALEPFQSATTVAKFNFNALDMNDERVLKVDVNSLYSKVGAKNKVELKIDNLAYDFGNGTAPKTTVKAAFNTDITKIVSPDQLEEIIPNLSTIIENFAKDYTEEFGDAITIESVVTSTSKDTDGKYIGLNGFISFKIDLSKVPAEEVKEIPLTEAVVSLGVNLKTGISIDGYIVSNPASYYFDRDQKGLKEYFETLLSGDTETLNTLLAFLVQLDRYAEIIAEGATDMDLSKIVH
ncbi:MAG: hypothetical protein EPN84_10095 [Legionella sp.]|nr:MAG: hypothetical protein EPN84_10095 [Legionella sp.]